MEIFVNGVSHHIPRKDANRKLLWILRDDLGLCGTRYGCGVGICGACTVHVDGMPTRSCITTVSSIEAGSEIRTVEGLIHNGQLHPIQQAFIDVQVPQCGWCMSGQMMVATALLENNSNPSRQEIRRAMSANYCRCGCYFRIQLAIERAAELMT